MTVLRRAASGCPSSLSPNDYTHDFYAIGPEVVAAGWVGVATDYEGLGTPGLHPYLVGESEGRGALDIVRAAGQLAEVGAGRRVVVWGRSQGGHAALVAGEIAPQCSLLPPRHTVEYACVGRRCAWPDLAHARRSRYANP